MSQLVLPSDSAQSTQCQYPRYSCCFNPYDILLPVLLADVKELVVLLLHLLLPLPVLLSHIIIVFVESDVSVAIFFNLLDDAFF